ncbi:MAG: hypothetical protein JW801_01625 [Bacteroidales bacterium]|nr:hypothetical protein [Bacteroidales bacterium]
MGYHHSIGQTKSAGYQVGVRRTVHVPLEETWNFLISKDGLELWLGTHELDKWETGIGFVSADGVSGSVRVFKVFSHIRLSCKMSEWQNESVLQLRTIPAKTGTTISFHQEQLSDATQRKMMKEHWEGILVQVLSALNS